MPIYKTSDVKKPNVTVVGSPTVVNGVASGFSNVNYLNLPNKFNPSNKNWEIGLKITTPSTFADYNYMIGNSTNNYQNIVLETNYNKLRWLITTSGTSYDYAVNSELTLDTSTTYYLRYAFTGSEYVCDVSTDNKTWERAITIESSTPMFAATEVARIGNNMGNYNWGGSIDISQCYININGSRWWSGMVYEAEKIKDIAITGQNTNCLTYIPQDVKLTLSNGTLILKAGSKVYYPNGFKEDGTTPKFDEVIIESDITGLGWTALTGMFFVLPNKKTLAFTGNSQIGSGSSHTLSGGNVWYDTTNNLVKRCNDSGKTWTSGYSLPICLATSSGSNASGQSTISSINQIFNGLGYIGSTVFALPNVKGLIPNGRNADGTLKSIEFEVSSVITYSRDLSQQSVPLWYKSDNTLLFSKGWEYDGTTNTVTANAGTSTGLYCHIATADLNTGVVSSFTPKAVKSPLKPHYIDKVYKGSTLVYQGAYKANQVVFEKSTAGTYSVNLEKAGLYEITVVGGGGAAAMRGVYDDKGYGWTGGSGGAFVGTFVLERGTRTVVVGKANNNTTAQSGNSQTLNPTDTKTYGSSVSGVVSVGGGGSGHYNSSYVGAAGAAATLTITPTSTTLNKAGNAGVSGSGGKGGGAGATINGGASVYNGYGKGQGCVTSEYAAKRSWINGTAGYVKIVYKGRRP